MRTILMLALIALAAGCSSEPEGYADVTGTVHHLDSLPFGNSMVAISCPRIALATSVPTDSVGRYSVALTAPSVGRFACSLAAPSLVAPEV